MNYEIITETGCWIYMGGLDDKGYPRNKAHRTALGLSPHDGKHACHKCDVPSCINPDHLYVGTPATNARDRSARGRHRNQQKRCCPKCGGDYRVGADGKRKCPACSAKNTAANRARYPERALELSRKHMAAYRAKRKALDATPPLT